MGPHVLVVVSFSRDGAPVCKCGAVAEWRAGDPDWGKVPGYYFPCRPEKPSRVRRLVHGVFDVAIDLVDKVSSATSNRRPAA